jgi:hypothetical protein
MQDVYRACKHGAQVCVVSRYDGVGNQLSSTPSEQVFNEHTPRFWTPAATTQVYYKEYAETHAEPWGLLGQGSSPIDFRCVRLELFYHPPYTWARADERRDVRKENPGICERMMLHLIAVKQAVSEEAFDQLHHAYAYTDPLEIAFRRDHDQIAELKSDILSLNEDLHKHELMQTELRAVIRELQRANQENKEMLHLFEQYRSKSQHLLYEHGKLRIFWPMLIKSKLDSLKQPADTLPPAFDPLKKFSQAVEGDAAGYVLARGVALQTVPYVEYPFTINRLDPREILLALQTDLLLLEGEVTAAILDQQGITVAALRSAAKGIDGSVPVRFIIDPDSVLAPGSYLLHVAVKNVDAPLYLLEYRKKKYGLFGPADKRLFYKLVFNEEG